MFVFNKNEFFVIYILDFSIYTDLPIDRPTDWLICHTYQLLQRVHTKAITEGLL